MRKIKHHMRDVHQSCSCNIIVTVLN